MKQQFQFLIFSSLALFFCISSAFCKEEIETVNIPNEVKQYFFQVEHAVHWKPNLQIRKQQNNIGITTTRPIKAGEVILEHRAPYILHSLDFPSRSDIDEVFKQLKEGNIRSDIYEPLYYFLHTNQEEMPQPWATWLRFQLKSYIPPFLEASGDDSLKEILEGSCFMQAELREKQFDDSIFTFYHKAAEQFKKEKSSWEEYTKMKAIVKRASLGGVIPMGGIDLIQHSFTPNAILEVKCPNPSGPKLCYAELVATTDIEAGEEIFVHRLQIDSETSPSELIRIYSEMYPTWNQYGSNPGVNCDIEKHLTKSMDGVWEVFKKANVYPIYGFIFNYIYIPANGLALQLLRLARLSSLSVYDASEDEMMRVLLSEQPNEIFSVASELKAIRVAYSALQSIINSFAPLDEKYKSNPTHLQSIAIHIRELELQILNSQLNLLETYWMNQIFSSPS